MVKISPDQKKLIEGGVLALATSTAKGNVNVVAVACCKVVGSNLILSTDNYFNKTRRNLLENSQVAVAVWSSDEKEGYQFKGEAQYLTRGKWKEMVDIDPDNVGLAHKAAVLIEVREIWDLVEPGLISKAV